LDSFFGEYAKELPSSLKSKYKIGVLSGGNLVLATYLSDNQPYTLTLE
jgi:hypothetical protein